MEDITAEDRPIRVYITPIADGVKADLNGELEYRKTETEIWDLIAEKFGDSSCLVTRRPPLTAESMPVANGKDLNINPHMPIPEQAEPKQNKTEVKFQSGVGGCSFKFEKPLDTIAFLDSEIPMIAGLFINHLAQSLVRLKSQTTTAELQEMISNYLDKNDSDSMEMISDFLDSYNLQRTSNA